MEPRPEPMLGPDDHQNKIAYDIMMAGYTLYGGYVYKTAVNGDLTSNINVDSSESRRDPLVRNLQETYKCQIVSSKEQEEEGDGICLLCPRQFISHPETSLELDSRRLNDEIIHDHRQYVQVDIGRARKHHSTHPFDIRLRIPGATNKVEFATPWWLENDLYKTVNMLRRRQYYASNDMRGKDERYFSAPLWTDRGSFSFMLKKVFGLVD